MIARVVMLAAVLAGCVAVRSGQCTAVVDDTLGPPLPVRGGPAARENTATGIVCEWAL